MRILIALLCVLALLVLASSARADDPPPPPPTWAGEAAGSWVQTTGNSSSQSIGAGLSLAYNTAPWKVILKSGFIRTELDDVTQAQKWAGLLRGERAISERASLFTQASAWRDTFAGINGLETFEGGAAYRLAPGPTHNLSVAASLGYTAEQRRLPDENTSYASGRLALGYKWILSSSADLSEEANWLSDLSDVSNWHLATTTALTASFSKVLALRVSHQLAYVNEPVLGKKKTDTTFMASVVAKWPAAK